ncbi:MAG: thiamine pyrophosphate-requiring protein [Candidatus Rokubacteria bacterium]|nr:thiamine pyrophosphate-requiring protein [Candidatus Rokubacteria bacterium]
MTKSASIESTAEAYLELLAARGVEYFFGNAGTDFAPLIEAYARRFAHGQTLPRPITVPHEIVAVSMAHGYAMITGRAQAVMLHVIVGTANGLGGVINAARSNIPMLFTAGRNPITESGFRGSRNRQIHWAQESFDQGAMVREFVKWDYELRNFAQLETVVDRALAITHAEPQAPVYLTLPREVLAERHDTFEYTDRARQTASSPVVADPAAVAEVARVLAAARNPIVITKAAGRDPLAVPALVRLAETLGCGVVEGYATYLNFPRTHPLHAGYDPDPYLDDADVIVALESDAPWFPQIKGPGRDTTVVQIGVDPLFSRYPIRGFPGDRSLAGQPRLTLAALADAVAPLVDRGAVAERRERWAAEHRRLREAWAAVAQKASTARDIEMSWLSRAIGQHIDDRTIVVNEYDLDPTQAPQTKPGTYFNSPPSSALGWGLGAALGAKLAAPDHTVICPVGDGAYIFGAPTAAHFVSRAYELPVVWIVCNNRTWNAVKRSTLGYAKDGWAVKTDTMPLTYLEPSPDYEMVCQASGGHGERVEDPAALPDALARAVRIVRDEKRQVLLNVICRKP